MLLNQDQFKTSIQTGLAWYPPSTGAMRMTMPVTINEILSFDRHHIKLGVGSTIILKHFQDVDISSTLAFLAHLRIAYRYQEKAGRYFWEVSIVPFLEGDTRAFELQALSSMSSHLWAGVSLGWAF
ncbi:MAG TPA: hypothetical protein VE870_03105 [Bacteroidales bacterium]|nr:hypothetical protein [Bacteroidales bacterium]